MLTAKDLLYKSLDYDGFWNVSKKMLHAQPSQCRKAQLAILMRAFGIVKKNAKAASRQPYSTGEGQQVVSVYASSRRTGSIHRMEYIKTLTDFQYFSTGEFLADMGTKVYQDLSGKIMAVAKSIFPDQAEVVNMQQVNLVRLFSTLYNFRLSVHLMFTHSLGKKMNTQFSVEENYRLYLRTKFMDSIGR